MRTQWRPHQFSAAIHIVHEFDTELRSASVWQPAFNQPGSSWSCLAQVYSIPEMEVHLKLARLNLPPHTIMRGPGFLQAVMVVEQARSIVISPAEPAPRRLACMLPAPAARQSQASAAAARAYAGAACQIEMLPTNLSRLSVHQAIGLAGSGQKGRPTY